MQGLHTHQQLESALLLLAEGPHPAHPPQADPLQSLCQVLLLNNHKEERYSICSVVFEHMRMYYHCMNVPATKFAFPEGPMWFHALSVVSKVQSCQAVMPWRCWA